jgi:signal transduction histidine kinase
MLGPRPMRNASIRTKVLVPVIMCMAVIIGLTVLIVNRRVTRQFRIEAWNTLAAADAVFRNYQTNRSDDLLLRFRNLPKEPRYRAAFQLGDAPTLRQPLADLLTEQGADIVYYAAGPKTILACEQREQTIQPASFESAASVATHRALQGHETVDVVRVGDHLYSVVSVPVFVERETVGALTLGLEIGDTEARRLSRLAHSQVAFLAGGHLSASTVSAPDVNEKCLEVLNNSTLPLRDEPPTARLVEVILDGEHYFGLSGRFGSLAGDETLGYVLLSSYEDSLRALKETQLLLLKVSACALLVGSLIVSWLIKKATQPLRDLREGVEAVGRGDFSQRLEIKSGDECGELARVYNEMAESLRTSKEQLEKANAELVESSRLAGMAEVATGVLHNVRNVMTTVNLASGLVAERVNKSKSSGLAKLVTMFREHENDLAAFLTQDAKGKKVVEYVSQLADHLANEQQDIVKDLVRMQKCIEHMKDVVKAQQGYAKTSGVPERLKVSELVEDALKMNSTARSNIQLVREFPEGLIVNVEKHKVLQILVNLIRNAKQACEGSLSPVGTLTLRAHNGGDRVCVAVTDNGIGIAPENLSRIFSHGFTTKKEGHGFGLHHSALVAKELGGALLVHSDGHGKGATFTLELPAEGSRRTEAAPMLQAAG